MTPRRIIESAANPAVRELLRVRDGKFPGDLWFVEGARLVQDLRVSGKDIKELFATREFLRAHPGFLRMVGLPPGQITVISEKVSRKLSDTPSPQGIFATVPHRLAVLHDLSPGADDTIPVLDSVQDPGNVGTILRTADAFGIKSVVLLEGTCNPSNPKVIRSSAGSVFRLDIAPASPEAFLTWSGKNHVTIAIADANADKTLENIALPGAAAIIFGNEAFGPDKRLKRVADDLFRIPLPGKAESLNVAVAASIVLYEVWRRRPRQKRGNSPNRSSK